MFKHNNGGNYIQESEIRAFVPKMPLGNHVVKDGDPMHIALDKVMLVAKENHIELSCAQIFLIGPQSAKENLNETEKRELATRIKAGTRIYAHSSYLSNPWGSKSAFGISLVKREMKLCEEIGIRGVVVHIARKPPAEIAEVIPQLLSSTNEDKTHNAPVLFLEIESYRPLEKDLAATAGTPARASIECTYETISKLNELVAAIIAKGIDMKRVGICIDTAHLWAAGMDLSTYAEMEKWLNEFPVGILRSNIIVHLNDQIWTLGGGKDEHAPLLLGTMWGKFHPVKGTDTPENSGLQAMLEWSEKNNIDLIMERKSVKPVFKDSDGNIINNIINDYRVLREMLRNGD